MRNLTFALGEYYHIYNRGVDKRNIFSNNNDVGRFIQSMCEFNTTEPVGGIYENSFLKKDTSQLRSSASKLVDFICYCINPNHYHFLIEQKVEKGIEKFMHRLGTGYTKYFNNKEKRTGSLFQGRFKAIHIDSNEYLLHLSAYINLNEKVHRQLRSSASELEIVSISSWEQYISNKNTDDDIFCKKDIVLDQFRTNKEYQEFAESSLEDILERKKLDKELQSLLFE